MNPVVTASQSSWRCVQSHDREGWLALMADDIVVEDPIGESVTNPDGTGVKGKEALAAFYDTNIGPNQLTITPTSWCCAPNSPTASWPPSAVRSPTRSTMPG